MIAETVREIDLHLTNRCNLTCAHCSVDSGRTRWGELTLGDWTAVVEDAVALGVRYYDLTGGEPALFPGVETLIELVTARGGHLQLQSNGLLLDEGRLERLWGAGLRNVVISLDGLEERHDRMRGRPGAFAAAVEAIRCAARLGYRVRVTRVITDATDTDDLAPHAELVARLGAAHLSLNHFSPVTSLHVSGWRPPSPQAWLALTGRLEALASRSGLPISYEVGFVRAEEAAAFFSGETRCLVERRRWFLVRSDGEVYPCYHFVHRPEMSLGNVREQPLSSLLHREERWSRYAGVATVPDACGGCSESRSCRGGCPSLGYLRASSLRVKDARCRIEESYVPVCPFVKRTAGTGHLTNIAPYYAATARERPGADRA